MERILKEELISLLDDLYNVLPSERSILNMRAMVSFAPETTIMDLFISNVYPHKDKILAKDIDFFKNEFKLAGGLLDFQKILNHKNLKEDDYEMICEYFNTYVALMEKHPSVNSIKSKTI